MAPGLSKKLFISSLLLLHQLEQNGRSVAAGAEVAGCTGEACPNMEEDASGLLQRELKKSYLHRDTGRRVSERNTKWAAFQGGGFRALGTYAGVVAGLLASKPGSKLGDEDGLFSGLDNIASNSGGSWFVSSLAYLEEFQALVEQTAATPANTSLWYEQYYFKFLKKLGSTGAWWSNLIPIPSHPSMAGVAEIVYQLLFIVEDSPPSWPEFVSALWAAGGGNDALTLGSPVNAWAKNKVWLAQSAVATLGGTGPGTCTSCPLSGLCADGAGRAVKVSASPDGDKHLQYQAQPNGGFSTSSLPTYLPAFWKFGLNSGTESALMPPFAQPQFDSMLFHYVDKDNQTATADSEPVGSWDFFENVGGKIPVVNVIGTSSAAAGGYFTVAGSFDNMAHALADYLVAQYVCGTDDFWECLAGKAAEETVEQISLIKKWNSDLAELAEKYLDWDWAMWTTMQGGETSFAKGDDLWKKIQKEGAIPGTDVPDLADAGLFAMVDGGYVDNTGVAAAVSNGATEVVAMHNSGPGDIFDLFAGVSDVNSKSFCPACVDHYQIFAEKNSTMWDLYNSESIPLKVISNATVLKSIAIWNGTATTVDNQWFGTTAGRKVQLNLVVVQSSLPDAFYNYEGQGSLVSEVAQSLLLPSNSASTATIWEWLTK